MREPVAFLVPAFLLAALATAAPPSDSKFAPRAGPVEAAALAPLSASAKPLLVLSLDGGYWAHRAPCWAGLIPITVVYEDGTVITLPPKRTWVRGQLGAAELDRLRNLAVRTNVGQYAGKSLTAINGSDMAILHVRSAVADPPVEVEVYGYSPFEYGQARWEHGQTPEPLAQLIDALFALREIEAVPYALQTARMRIVDTRQSCASRCAWPKAWSAPAVGVRDIPLQTGDIQELGSEWERTCPPEMQHGKPHPQPREFCKGDKQFAWCAGPAFPGVPARLDGPVPPHR